MDTDQVRIQQRGDLAVLALELPMLTSLEAERLLTTLRDYKTQTGCGRFVIEMSGVDFIDSACIGSLVTFLIEIDKQGGKLVLAGCTKTVAELLKITGLSAHIPLVSCVDEAVQAYGKPTAKE